MARTREGIRTPAGTAPCGQCGSITSVRYPIPYADGALCYSLTGCRRRRHDPGYDWPRGSKYPAAIRLAAALPARLRPDLPRSR
jgi:hypothetical protein